MTSGDRRVPANEVGGLWLMIALVAASGLFLVVGAMAFLAAALALDPEDAVPLSWVLTPLVAIVIAVGWVTVEPAEGGRGSARVRSRTPPCPSC